MQEGITEPAPTVKVSILSPTGQHFIDVLPDSGADICAAGQEVLSAMGHHMDNILPSHITPKTVNGLNMTPLGRVPVTISLGQARYDDDIHIYPGIAEALLSWKATRGLGILPPCYPQPILQANPNYAQTSSIQIGQVNCSITQDLID